MKVLKDEDLLSLHYQIEKSEIKQKKLEDLLEIEAEKLRRTRKSNRLFGSFSVVFLLLAVFLIANAFYSNKSTSKKSQANSKYAQEILALQNELNIAKNELEVLKKEKATSKEIQDLYLYRSLISRDTVFSVQIKAANNKKISSISQKFTNTLVYSDASLYKLSLGIFETLTEAQDFRKTLIQSGILDKRIFVISYKDGKRIRIEDYR
ncbi:hypothetical protein [Aquimarina aggregata]|uniref:hypothetical protein n=1 Tax=Aquimarina aggregata TaxID=1642818 RepID=UPI0024928CE9|nr:hypothetical protein [Aquimarina aggregata]